MRLHSKLFSLLFVYNGLSIALCDLTSNAIELCGNVGVVYRYYNHNKFQSCVDGMKELMQNTVKETILTDIRAIEKHVGNETALKAYKLFRSKHWCGATIERLLTRIEKSKDLDHFSKFDIINMVLDYTDHPYWMALLSDQFLRFFDLFSVIDCILQQKKYSTYVVNYHNWLIEGPGSSKQLACETYVAMDIFTFLIQYSQERRVYLRQPDDSYAFFEIICDKKSGWTDESLVATFGRQDVLQLDKYVLKVYLKHIKAIPQLQQSAGSCYDWTVGLVAKQIEKAKGDEDLAAFSLKAIGKAPNVMTPFLVDSLVAKVIAKEVNKSNRDVEDVLDTLALLSKLFVHHLYSMCDFNAHYFADFVLRSSVFLRKLEDCNGRESAETTYRSFFSTALYKRCTMSQMISKLDYYDYLVRVYRYQVSMFYLFGYFYC